jgi:uncharacterized membrane protein YraQ (UPF0718 family)
MDLGFWLIALMAFVLAGYTVYHRGMDVTLQGLSGGGRLLLDVFPRLIFAFAVAGLIQVLVPAELISKSLGKGSGLKGLLIGSLGGAITPGGPMTHFPIMASFYRSGADIGPLLAYLTAWSLLSIPRLIVWEIPILGAGISLVRYSVCLILPPVVGFAGGILLRLVLPRLSP